MLAVAIWSTLIIITTVLLLFLWCAARSSLHLMSTNPFVLRLTRYLQRCLLRVSI